MNRCKDTVIEMIDEAVGANYSRGVCECGRPGLNGNKCNYCKIKEALQMSRSCLITSVVRIERLRSNMAEMQKEIEAKLRKLLEEE